MRRVVTCGSLAACLVAAACGGSKNAHYSAAIALPCLDPGSGATQAAEGRYVPIHVHGTRLNISFEKTVKDALRTATEAKVYATDEVSGDTVFREGNAVLVWERPPSAAERQRVETCLARAIQGG